MKNEQKNISFQEKKVLLFILTHYDEKHFKKDFISC